MTHHVWTQIRDIAEMVIITALVVIFIRNVAITYTVNGPSMEPTLDEDHRVLVNRLGAIGFWGISLYGQPDFLFEGPERGDIIVFEPQQAGTEKIVKRVIGLPGRQGRHQKRSSVRQRCRHQLLGGPHRNQDPASIFPSSCLLTNTSFWATTEIRPTTRATGGMYPPKTSSAKCGCSIGRGKRFRHTETQAFLAKSPLRTPTPSSQSVPSLCCRLMPVHQSLGQVVILDESSVLQVGNRTRYLEDTMARSRRKSEVLHRAL